MKILLVSEVYKYYTSGVAGVVITLDDALKEMGHEVKVISLSNTRESFKKDGNYYIASVPSRLYPEMRQCFVHEHPFFDEIEEWGPDVLHVHTEGSAVRFAKKISDRTKAPIVMTFHTNYAQFVFHRHYNAPPVRLLFSVLANAYYHNATVITVPSEKAGRVMASYKVKSPIRVIPNGIRMDMFRKEYSKEEREELFSKWGIPDNGKTFVIVSRISKEKNLEEILDYFVSLTEEDKEIHLLVAGDGPDLKSLEKRSESLGLAGNVVFTGKIPRDELYRYYKSGIAFLSASTFEMHSLTYLEAMACGVPLICRDDPCLAGVLDDGVNGYRYTNRKEFHKSCRALIRDKALQRAMVEASLKKSEDFTDRIFAERVTALYTELIS